MPDGRVNNGGARKGSGRKTAKHEFVDTGELTPLEYGLELMRNKKLSRAVRFEAMKATIPYCSARLQHVSGEVDHELTLNLISYLDVHRDQLAKPELKTVPVGWLASPGKRS